MCAHAGQHIRQRPIDIVQANQANTRVIEIEDDIHREREDERKAERPDAHAESALTTQAGRGVIVARNGSAAAIF